MTGIGKNRREVSANPSCSLTLQGSNGKTSSFLENAKVSRLLGAGGTGNVHEKTFVINCHGICPGIAGRSGTEVAGARTKGNIRIHTVETLSIELNITQQF
jgi:hypothetical protein